MHDYDDNQGQGQGSALIPPGKYRARATEGALGETANGNEQIALAFDLLDQNGQPTGQTATYYGTFSEKAMEFTFNALRNMGWKGTDVTELDGNLAGVADSEVQLTIAHEEYPEGSGDIRMKVKWVNKPGGIAMKNRLEGGAKAQLAQRLKAFALASLQGAPAAARPASAGGPPVPSRSRIAAPVHAPGKDPWKTVQRVANQGAPAPVAPAPINDEDLPF